MRVRRQATATQVAALLLGAVLALAVPGLTGCATDPPRDVVAVALPSDAGRFGDLASVLRSRLTAEGFEVEVLVSDGEIPAQVQQVHDAFTDGVAALVVWPVDAEALTPVLDAAPPETEVLALGVLVRDTAAVDDYVAFDAAAGGRLQAIALLQGLGLVDDDGAPVVGTAGGAPAGAPAGPFRIELVAGSTDDPATKPALAAAMDVLKPYLASRTIVVGSGETGLVEVATLRGNAETAASRMTRILRESYGDALPDAVLATSDELARGVATALLEAGALPGEGFPVVTGRGSELRALAALVAGRQYATLLEDPRALAAAAADAVVAARDAARATPTPSATPEPEPDVPTVDVPTVDNGAARVPVLLVPPVAVRLGDIDGVVIGSGYWTRERVDEAIVEYALTP
ncbi:MAG: substrate-binding domain-containing protein [Schumannella sp.]